METATYKVGLNRGRRRVWIDGPRLARAGFVPGVRYWAPVSLGLLTLSLTEMAGSRQRTVSGRPSGKPIVDITGADVELAFPTCAAVEAVFKPGVIEITPSIRNDG